MENIANGIDTTYESVLKNIQQRDENDSKRAVAPLIAASDAIQIDTDDLDLEGVVDEILKWVG